MGLLEEMLQQQGVTPPGLTNQQVPEIPLQRMPQVPGPGMQIPPVVPPQAPQEQRKPMKEVISDFAGNFLFALSRAMAASAQAPGPRGSMLGTAAALETPMLMQQAQAAQQAEIRKLQMDNERLELEKKKADNDATRLDAQEQLAKLNAATAAAKEKREAAESEARIAELERKAKELTKLGPDESLADPATGQIKVTAPGRAPTPGQATASIQEYNFYAEQERAAGRTPLSFDAYQEREANRRKPLVEINTGGPSPYATERAVRTIQSVDELITQISPWTTGFGSLLANLPATEARYFEGQLNTLKANIAFNELTAMREASKTGGALGQVSNIELELLQSALGSLDTRQRGSHVKTQLERIKASVERWQTAVEREAAKKGGKSAPPPDGDIIPTPDGKKWRRVGNQMIEVK